MFHKVLGKLIYYARNRINWGYMLTKVKQRVNKYDVLDIDNKKCVALIPHADDELIGMGSLLSKNKSIKLIYFEFLGSDYSEENKIVRLNEFKRYCSRADIQFDFFDAKAKKDIQSADLLLLPSLIDWHEEHRKLNYILRDILEEKNINPQIVWFNISVYNSSNKYAYYIVENKNALIQKYNVFKTTYVSQKTIPVLRFKIKERLYGRNIGEYAAEKFFVFEYNQWVKITEAFQTCCKEDDMMKLKLYLNRFDALDVISKVMYEELVK